MAWAIEKRDYRTGHVIERINLDYEPHSLRILAHGGWVVLGFDMEAQQWLIEQRDSQGVAIARFDSQTPLAAPIVADDGTILDR